MGVEDLEMSHGDRSTSIADQPANNSLLSNSRCCFCFPCFNPRPSSSSSYGGGGAAWWERFRSSSTTDHAHDDRWWSSSVRTFKKMREWSEIVAGPKWKTFIRRFNRNRSGGNARHGQFQYDPLSYALNFDEGQSGEFHEEEEDGYGGGFRDFSSRYAAVSVSGKPLAMDASGTNQVVVA